MTISSKRLFDLVFAVPALVASLPVQAITAAAIAATLGRPVLFRQQRPGLFGEPFELVKFRTMRPPDQTTGVVADADRLTRMGTFLRSTSLDELPTLWNVIRGDMSIVGPRPLRMHYLPLYNEYQARRHEVRPGITGLAQVSGRNETPWEKRFDLDVEYVDRQTIMLDVKVIWMTLDAVWKRKGISAKGVATMTPFRGTE